MSISTALSRAIWGAVVTLALLSTCAVQDIRAAEPTPTSSPSSQSLSGAEFVSFQQTTQGLELHYFLRGRLGVVPLCPGSIIHDQNGAQVGVDRIPPNSLIGAGDYVNQGCVDNITVTITWPLAASIPPAGSDEVLTAHQAAFLGSDGTSATWTVSIPGSQPGERGALFCTDITIFDMNGTRLAPYGLPRQFLFDVYQRGGCVSRIVITNDDGKPLPSRASIQFDPAHPVRGDTVRAIVSLVGADGHPLAQQHLSVDVETGEGPWNSLVATRNNGDRGGTDSNYTTDAAGRVTFTFAAADAGDYRVSLSLFDDSGRRQSGLEVNQAAITVANHPIPAIHPVVLLLTACSAAFISLLPILLLIQHRRKQQRGVIKHQLSRVQRWIRTVAFLIVTVLTIAAAWMAFAVTELAYCSLQFSSSCDENLSSAVVVVAIAVPILIVFGALAVGLFVSTYRRRSVSPANSTSRSTPNH